MSRLGKRAIKLQSLVSVHEENSLVLVKGPKGELSLKLTGNISLDIANDNVVVNRPNDERKSKELHGLYRSLISNMVQGVSEGFVKNIEMHGIGYRVQQKEKALELSLGYSHPVLFKLPDGVASKVEGQTKIELTSIDKQLLGETCASIRKLRKKDPYKGKGIHFAGEIITKKPGKSVKK